MHRRDPAGTAVGSVDQRLGKAASGGWRGISCRFDSRAAAQRLTTKTKASCANCHVLHGRRRGAFEQHTRRSTRGAFRRKTACMKVNKECWRPAVSGLLTAHPQWA